MAGAKRRAAIGLNFASVLLRGQTKKPRAAAAISGQHHDINADESIRKVLVVLIAKMADDYDQATLRSLKNALAGELANPRGLVCPR
jgi:hypothetical protein